MAAGRDMDRRAPHRPQPRAAPSFTAAAMSLSAAAAREMAAERICAGVFRVASVERDAVRRDPVPSITTATLQQEVSRRLGSCVRKTRSVAQDLYEGVALDGGSRWRRCRLRPPRNRVKKLRPTAAAIGRKEGVQ